MNRISCSIIFLIIFFYTNTVSSIKVNNSENLFEIDEKSNFDYRQNKSDCSIIECSSLINDGNNRSNIDDDIIKIKNDLSKHLPAYGIFYELLMENIENNKNKNLSQNPIEDDCIENVRKLLIGINRKEPWALKVLDASGAPESGFVFGNNFWYGSELYCERAYKKFVIMNDPKSNLLKQMSPFPLKYVTLMGNYTTNLQYKMIEVYPINLQIGICIPKSCSNLLIQKSSENYFKHEILEFQQLYNLKIHVEHIKESSFLEFIKTPDVILCVIFLCFVIVLVLFFNVYLHFNGWIKCHQDHHQNLKGGANDGFNINGNSNNLEIEIQNNIKETINNPTTAITMITDNNNCNNNNEKRLILAIADCFDLKKNFNDLISIPKDNEGSSSSSTSDVVLCVNGLKSISCLLIISQHCAFFIYFMSNNQVEPQIIIFDLLVQILFQFINAVEIFFVISGFLLSYNFLKNSKQFESIQKGSIIENLKFFVRFVLKRYFRLTPAILTTMALSHILANYIMKVRPFQLDKGHDLYCIPQSWWRNLLYVQNFYPVKEMCADWTWYMAAEMQYFLIFSTILMIYAKNKFLAKIIFIILSIATVSYSFYVYCRENYIFHMDIDFIDAIYISSLVRMNSYFGGIFAGYLYYKIKDRPIKITRTIKYLWYLMIIINLLIFKIAIDVSLSDIPRILVWLTSSLGHYLEGYLIGISIIILTIQQLRGGFLQSEFFQHFHKLTYFMYLLNPIIIITLKSNNDKPSHFSISDTFIEAIGLCTLCYFVSFIFTLFYEIPFRRLGLYLCSNTTKK